MKKQMRMIFMTMFMLAVVSTPGVCMDDWYERSESRSADVSDVSTIEFDQIDFTDFEYQGVDDAHELAISVTYRVKSVDEDVAEDILDEFDLEIDRSGDRLVVNMNHPKQHDKKLFGGILNRDWKEWRIVMTVTGPRRTDIDLDSDFSEVTMMNTAGTLSIDADFTETTVNGHTGLLNAKCDFGEFTVKALAGGFHVANSFGNIEIDVADMNQNSEVNSSFGGVNIHLPRGENASIVTEKSFGGVDFNFDEPVQYTSSDKHEVDLNGGGPRLRVTASFGGIKIDDKGRPAQSFKDEPDLRATRPEPVETKQQVAEKPAFTGGIIRTIHVRGLRMLRLNRVIELLHVTEGNSYSVEELDRAVHRLPEREKLISSAYYRVENGGDLVVVIDESDLYDAEWDGSTSFSRSAGLGLGPSLTLSSLFGPLSELKGEGEYHFGNEEWTYRVSGEKRFFRSNNLTIGGSYRKAYESNMDWAVDPHDVSMNAFFLGLETTNQYQVEGANAFVSQKIGPVTVSATYFDDDFSSLEKTTNWSLFNLHHEKAINPALGLASEGRISGVRYEGGLDFGGSITRTWIDFSVEQAQDVENPLLSEYTRYLASLRYSQQLAYSSAILFRVSGGYSEDTLPDQKAFRLGGLNTLRGYESGSVLPLSMPQNGFVSAGGGEQMVLANLEYVLSDDGDYYFAFFGDVGGVWSKDDVVSYKDLRRDLGIGLVIGDCFDNIDFLDFNDDDTLRINWAVPVGNVPHVSNWTVNFFRPF
jgi:hypothetical protein